MKKFIFICFLCLLWVSLYAERDMADYMFLSHSNQYMMPESKSPQEDAFSTPREIIIRYRKIIIRAANAYHIEPELLADVVFVETYGGGISGWYELKNRLSVTKQFLFGNATIGITQVTPHNIKDFQDIINYNYDVFWQLGQGARQLASIKYTLYPNTPHLTEERMMNVLRFYNQGTKQKIYSYSKEENPVGHYALASYKKNLRIRKRLRLEKKPPYFSCEIAQYDTKKKATVIYMFGVPVAEYRIGGSKNKANSYAFTAYRNRERIRRWLKGE
ncbi:MAG: hypothetical protein KBT47_01455 [Armatimonadetes bacterium]|nr:hypothetical protein [Candidatus Hippobium faecium]